MTDAVSATGAGGTGHSHRENRHKTGSRAADTGHMADTQPQEQLTQGTQ